MRKKKVRLNEKMLKKSNTHIAKFFEKQEKKLSEDEFQMLLNDFWKLAHTYNI